MKNRYTFAFFISLVSLSSLHALRPGQKRGPEPAQQEPTVVLQEVIAQEMPIASEPTAQDLQELSNKLDQAQGEIAKGTIVQSDPKEIAQARSFVVMARELTACYAPRMLWGKKCDEAKKERLKAELRAQLPAMDRKLLMKLGLGALALASLIAVLYKFALPDGSQKVLNEYAAGTDNLELIVNHAKTLPDDQKTRFYLAAQKIALEKKAGEDEIKALQSWAERYPLDIQEGGQVKIEND